MRIGVIGVGNMGYAILKGLTSRVDSEDIFYFDIDSNNISRVKEIIKKDVNLSAIDLVQKSDYIILALKPNIYELVLDDISTALTDTKTIISIAPGLSLDYLKARTKAARVVRAMPNTPAMVLEGMSGISFFDSDFTVSEIEEIKSIFESFGKCVVVDEKYMDAVVAISGCTPAYFFTMIEAMGDAGVEFGLPRAQVYTMAAQTMLGSAKILLTTEEHPAKLKDDVCSPGGATIAGVNTLNKMDFRAAITEAMKATYQKSLDMGKK